MPSNYAIADAAGFASGWQLKPRLNLALRWIDNVDQAPVNEQSDYIAEVVPGLSLSGRSARAYGAFRFDLRSSNYVRDESRNRIALIGGGQGSVDLYERKLMLDAFANFSDERISALDTVSTNYDAERQTHVSIYSLSPYLRWQWLGDTQAELRYRATYSDFSSQIVDQNLRHDFDFTLGSGSSRPLSWSLRAQQSLTDYLEAEDVRISSARLNLGYALDPLLSLRVIGGYEHNSFANIYGNDQTIYGAGLTWTPSPRTRFSGYSERRFFGHGYNYELAWRGPRSGISAVFLRDLSSTTATLGSSQLGSLFASYWLALKDQFPDPVERATRVGELWRSRGLPATVNSNTSYVTQNYYVDTRGQVSVNASGVRTSLGASVAYSERQRIIDPALLSPNDEMSRYGRTREISASAFVSYALSPKTQLSLGGGYGRSRGVEGALVPDAETRRHNLSVAASTQLGPQASGSVSYSHVSSRGYTAYQENQVGANLGLNF